MNEAALQLCKLKPILLTNRNLLLKLARHTVRLSEYKYSKGHSRSQFAIKMDDLGLNEGDSLPENLDSIEIEIMDEDNNYSQDSFDTVNGKSSSSESNRDGQAVSKKPFAGLKEQNSKFIITGGFGQNGNDRTQDGNTSGSSHNGNGNGNNNGSSHNTNGNSNNSARGESNGSVHGSFEEERKRRLDQVEMISRQIELNGGQITELRRQLENQLEGQQQPENLNENESLSKLLKLEDDQKLLIEEKNNLVNQIQKLHR